MVVQYVILGSSLTPRAFSLVNRPQDYIFSLLTGYRDPPAGFEIREGMNYNPYFPGNAISMARVLFDGLVEYDDGEVARPPWPVSSI